MNKAVGLEIKAWRARREMSQDDLALASGMTVTQVRRIENNQRDFNVTQLAQIAGALNVPADQILRDAVDKHGGLEALITPPVSEVQRKNVTPLRRVEDMTVDEIEAEQKKAATIDPEMDTDEQFD